MGLFLSAVFSRDFHRILTCEAANAHVVFIALHGPHESFNTQVSEGIGVNEAFYLFYGLVRSDKFLPGSPYRYPGSREQ